MLFILRQCVMLLLLIFTVACSVAASERSVLRAVVSDSNTPPYAIFDDSGKLTAGLSKDILDALALVSQLDIQYLDLPRARIESWLETGQADIACFLNPDWVAEPTLYLWSPPLFATQQLFIRRADSQPINALPDLAGKRVGTTRGFTYPELEQVFALGDVIRDDAHSLQSNLKRLEQGRLDVVMSVDLSYYFFMNNGGLGRFGADPIWSAPPSVYCAISRHNSQLSSRLLRGLNTLVDNKFISRQLRRYKGEPAE
ncbi:polar amino acid transport system substrate-binding protein [Arsukibacterium tuosuense]|uniref:Polar amino acid transport system substrate-binding protein n=1 Tax=Arsukibacterium tuosuense TaxID=1323745 RepID=A0A285IS18_9GAMM|nr:transporter substrate-binding domain-containing protein [Arsukibacterium tuosuense]SNY50810.1 polar amino acid transport system substrate-binding protein [Arsukibacterium tuosuense]